MPGENLLCASGRRLNEWEEPASLLRCYRLGRIQTAAHQATLHQLCCLRGRQPNLFLRQPHTAVLKGQAVLTAPDRGEDTESADAWAHAFNLIFGIFWPLHGC
jgi:hypothetical protein